MTDTDAVLLHRWARERDAEAFRDLVERYARMVHATARRILTSPDQAEDVTQECFLKLANGPDAPERSLSAWLHRVATNLSISRLRAERRLRAAERQRSVQHGSEYESSWHEVEHAVDEAIAALPSGQRIPVVEHFLRGRTHESIARDLGVSREAVTYRVRMGIRAIRESLERRGMRARAAVLVAGLEGVSGTSLPTLSAGLGLALGRIAIAGPGAFAVAAPVVGSSRILMTTLILAIAVAGGVSLLGNHEPPRAAPASPALGAHTESGDSVVVPKDPSATGLEQLKPQGKRTPVVSARNLSGRVVDAKGRAVAGAEVAIAWPREDFHAPDILNDTYLDPGYWSHTRMRSARSNAAGEFVFRGVPASGSAMIAVFHDGSFVNRRMWNLGKDAATLVLKLGAGATFRGSVVTNRGAPIVGAMVSVYYAHDSDGYTGYPGFAATDPAGKFKLGLDPGTEHVTLRVCSVTHGQQFFMAVSAGDVAELRYRPSGAISGKILWTDGTPATGVKVCVEAGVPEPRMSTSYSGRRRRIRATAPVGADGTYRIDGLYPEFTYNVFVIDPKAEARRRFMAPLSPRWTNRHTAASGETHQWDYSLSKPIKIRGRVLTESTKRPVPGIRVCLKKDGAKLNFVYCETDTEGGYELSLNTGSGKYTIVATPQSSFDAVSEVIAARFGRDLALRAGDERKLDLTVHEPSVIPILVVDADGKPARSIRFKISHRLPNGRRTGLGSSCRLDDQGRHRFEIFHPVAATSLEIHAFPEGPKVDVGEFRPEVGQALPEKKVALPATCGLTGTVVLADGKPLAKTQLKIRAEFVDGVTETFYVNTDEHGRFEKKARVRIAPVVLKIGASKWDLGWGSETLQPKKGEELQLGRVVAR